MRGKVDDNRGTDILQGRVSKFYHEVKEDLAVEDHQITYLNTEIAGLQDENDDLTNLLQGNNFFF
jgi:hypothetical protein